MMNSEYLRNLSDADFTRLRLLIEKENRRRKPKKTDEKTAELSFPTVRKKRTIGRGNKHK